MGYENGMMAHGIKRRRSRRAHDPKAGEKLAPDREGTPYLHFNLVDARPVKVAGGTDGHSEKSLAKLPDPAAPGLPPSGRPDAS
jgi:hypothetical protein